MDPIATVEAIPVSYPEPNDFDALRHLCLVKVTTKDGVVGWGESITMWTESTFAVKALVEGMADLVVGRGSLDNIAIWHSLHDRAWWYGYGGGLASFAMAAIDIALWDIKGKLLGVPVVQLLGGAVHEKLPTVASCHAHFADIGRMVEEAQEWVAPGLHGVKVGFGKRGDAHLGYEHDRDVEYMRRMREGLGPDQLIMIDCGWKTTWDVMTATRRIAAFEEWDLHWIEEPLGAWDPPGYADLRTRTTTLIAYGEKEWDLAGYERVLATGTVDVVGVDPGRAQGITGFPQGDRAGGAPSAPVQRACLVVGHRHGRQPGRQLRDAQREAHRGEAAAQSHAARPRRRAAGPPGGLVLPAHEARPGDRGHRRGGRPLSLGEGPARPRIGRSPDVGE